MLVLRSVFPDTAQSDSHHIITPAIGWKRKGERERTWLIISRGRGRAEVRERRGKVKQNYTYKTKKGKGKLSSKEINKTG